jgi:hypothetical protein
VLAGDHHDVATSSAIATAGAALGDKFLAPERKNPVAAVTGFHKDYNFIDEQGG